MIEFGNLIDTRARLMASDREVWRVIEPEWESLYNEIWRDGTIEELCGAKLLLQSQLSNGHAEPGGMLFRQPRLKFPTYPFEWCPSMYRDAAFKSLALHEALEQFATHDPLRAKLVELRFFAGLTLQEAADCLDISLSTAVRGWRYARAWLYDAMSGDISEEK